eukprot:5021492-Amphidinium_carterae.1
MHVFGATCLACSSACHVAVILIHRYPWLTIGILKAMQAACRRVANNVRLCVGIYLSTELRVDAPVLEQT